MSEASTPQLLTPQPPTQQPMTSQPVTQEVMTSDIMSTMIDEGTTPLLNTTEKDYAQYSKPLTGNEKISRLTSTQRLSKGEKPCLSVQ